MWIYIDSKVGDLCSVLLCESKLKIEIWPFCIPLAKTCTIVCKDIFDKDQSCGVNNTQNLTWTEFLGFL